MPASHRSILWITWLSLCGCPLGTPRDHYRPHGHQDTTLDVSPTEDAIVFNAKGAGGRDLYLLRLSDLQATRIADTPEYETWPSFSPDGQTLVYSAGVPGDRADHIFKRPVVRGSAEQMTHDDANDSSPRFSPDGSMIVFARDKTYIWGGLAANWETGGVICLMQSDGTKLRQLTSDGDYAFEPRFSPDGASVIFSTREGMASVPIDGSSPPQKIHGPPGAVTSLDSSLLAYSTAYTKEKYSGHYKIYVSKADGSDERLLTPDRGACFRPLFSRNSDLLFYLPEEWPSGPTKPPKSSIWEVAIDGSFNRAITDNRLFDDPLRWKPRKSK
jgi:TolB protein